MFASKDIFLKSSGGYQISRSVRLRSSASAYLNRTPAVAGNRRTWTWSGWVKLGVLSTDRVLFSATNGTTFDQLRYSSSDNSLQLSLNNGTYNVNTSAFFRDPSSWYSVLFYCDTTNATSTERLQIWVNGVRQAVTSATYPTQNYDTYVNTTNAHQIGRVGTSGYFDGYLTEINFIDGQALTPSSFGETNSITGVWQPKRYSGTYGTNGFYLNFSDNSAATATTIGKDYSGNGNNWTPNNISVTSGVTYDSMLDVPTQWADGGNGRGNYAVMNPLNNTGTLSNANLTFTGTDKAVLSTIAIPTSGKYYFEATCTTVANFSTIGIANVSSQASSFNGVIASANFRTYNSGGEKADSTRTAGWGSTFTSGDVIGVAVDMDNGAIYFAKNNTWQASGVPTSGASKTGAAFTDLTSSGITWTAFFSAQNSSGVWSPTFGQRPFTYTPPTGFVALNTQNLPTPTISNGATVMAATTYTGTGSSLTIANTVNGISFQPDWVWVKGRSGATDHALYDSVRGTTKDLVSNSTAAETTQSTGLTAFGSTGFTVGALAKMNTSSATYVAWQWQAGQGSTSSNTSGSITSTVSAGATQGFSVVTWTSASGTNTVGHGLGVAPKMIIAKNRSIVSTWPTYHASIGGANILLLDTTNASAANTTYFNGTAPTNSVFSTSTGFGSGNFCVAYCFAAVAGYSAFGSYTGNGSADGPFVYLGFRPRFVMIKRTDTTGNWLILDTSRNTYNVVNAMLTPNLSDAEATGVAGTNNWDFLSNGFKPRGTGALTNANGGTYIYAAFAEVPFRYANAR